MLETTTLTPAHAALLEAAGSRTITAGMDEKTRAAACIAAFLRALPPDALLTHYGWSRAPLAALAEAVEKAAQPR